MKKLLKFGLGGVAFGMEITQVQEILLADETPVYAVPNSPGHLRGIINLRGVLAPLIDLRLKTGWPAGPVTPKSRIIICRSRHGTAVGGLVDELMDLRESTHHTIEGPSSQSLGVGVKAVMEDDGGSTQILDFDDLVYGSGEPEA